MALTDELSILESITDAEDFHTGVFFSYGADLAFFEDAILRPLWANGCRKILLFMDAERYADTIRDMGRGTRWAGRRYLIVPVALGHMRAFHPKLVLLLGNDNGRLLVGSGNLTFSGYGQNFEIYSRLDITGATSEHQSVVGQAWRFVEEVLSRWGCVAEANGMLQRSRFATSVVKPSSQVSDHIRFLHNLDETLIQQCGRLLQQETVERITVVSPFLDNSAAALNAIHKKFEPRELRLVVQEERAVGNVKALEKLRSNGVPLRIFRFQPDDRYLHAKVYIFETGRDSFALTGSANCTRAAWMTTAANGNVEAMVLRRGRSKRHFAPLLTKYVSRRPLSTLVDLKLRPMNPVTPEEREREIRLLDVSIEGDALHVQFDYSELADTSRNLALRLAQPHGAWMSIGAFEPGSHHVSVDIPDEVRQALNRPVAVSIWGLNKSDSLIDLGCNEVWLNNVDLLRSEIARMPAVSIRTGGLLHDMLLESEDEWRELYETLAQLIELDVDRIKKKTRKYSSDPSKKRGRGGGDADTEKEIDVTLVDEIETEVKNKDIAEAIYRENPFYPWFEHVLGSLPGGPRPTDGGSTESDGQRDGSGTPPSEKDKSTRRRLTPPERVSRRFVRLVNKYIRAMRNAAYMQATPVHFHLAYFTVFQKIIWLLYKHNAIDVERYANLAIDVCAGFFGRAGDVAPALAVERNRHIRHAWHNEWQASDAASFALASLAMCSQLLPPGTDKKLRKRLKSQARRVVACAAVVSDLQNGTDNAIEQVAATFESNPAEIRRWIQGVIDRASVKAQALLRHWLSQVALAIEDMDEDQVEAFFRSAKVDYLLGQYRLHKSGGDVDGQARLLRELLDWLPRVGDSDLVRRFQAEHLKLLEAQGNTKELAVVLYKKGQQLFFDANHEEAANVLHQAAALAERVGDSALAGRCAQYLGYTSLFLNSAMEP